MSVQPQDGMDAATVSGITDLEPEECEAFTRLSQKMGCTTRESLRVVSFLLFGTFGPKVGAAGAPQAIVDTHWTANKPGVAPRCVAGGTTQRKTGGNGGVVVATQGKFMTAQNQHHHPPLFCAHFNSPGCLLCATPRPRPLV